MWPFKDKKKIYCIKWYCYCGGGIFTDYIKAKDVEQAVRKLRKREENFPLVLQSIEVYRDRRYFYAGCF